MSETTYPHVEQVCNLALARIGQYSIRDITASGETERVLRLHWPQVRRGLIRSHAWTFAVRRAELALSVDENAWGHEFRYDLPDDYLQTLKVCADKSGRHRIDKFKIEGFALTSDHEKAYLEYIADVCSSVTWPPDFVDCVAALLAARISYNLGGGAMAGRLYQELEEILLPRAMTNNAWEDGSGENHPLEEIFNESHYLNSYRGN